MSLQVEVVTALIGMTASLVAAAGAFAWKEFFQEFLNRIKNKEKDELKKNVTEIGIDLGIVNIKHKISDNVEPVRAEITNDLIDKIEQDILNKVSSSPGLSKEEVRKEIEKKIDAFRQRLESIESRFPDQDSIDKIASINDALFAERIEQLSKRMESLEEKHLSKWDVAIVVSMVLAGVFAVVGATYSVISVVNNAS